MSPTAAPDKVLLVEDFDLIRHALARVLRREGYHVTTAATARAARELGGPFDIGIFDLHLPDGDGVTVATAFRTVNPAARIVFFTSSLDTELVAHAQRLGEVVRKDHVRLLGALRRR